MHHRIAQWAKALPILIVLAVATPAAAVDVPQRLAVARAAVEQGRLQEAVANYRQYIESHPLVQSVFVRKDKHLAPSQIHNFLIAVAELTELQRLAGNKEEHQEVLKKLDGVARGQAIDAINRYHLARVYLENDRLQDGIATLEKITSDQESYPQSEHNKVYLRACAKLLEIFAEQGNLEAVGNVTNRLRRSLALFSFDLKDRYKIARLLLENAEAQSAEEILRTVAQESDPAVLRSEEFTIIQAAIKLLELYTQRAEQRAGDRLLESLEKRFKDRPLAPRNHYLLALAVQQTGRGHQAAQMLNGLVDSAPGTEWGTRAAALLGRRAPGDVN